LKGGKFGNLIQHHRSYTYFRALYNCGTEFLTMDVILCATVKCKVCAGLLAEEAYVCVQSKCIILALV
jgi:hypothetical protein